jgi:membrane protein implicated in regulation of membrane protease activity
MGLAYLFALLVGMGILTIQAVLGSKDADTEGDVGADKDFDAHKDFDKDIALGGDAGDIDADADAHAEGDHGAHHDHGGMGIAGAVALFLSLRFWIFASLGFGLSGTLLTYLTDVNDVVTLVAAIVMGLGSGLGAALAFRALKRTSSRTAEHTSSAVGRMGRVIVPVDKNSSGKVRIELDGQHFDLIAKSSELRIERGDLVVIDDVDGEIAEVSRAPRELSE